MKWMNFIPLLVWAIGFMWLLTWDEHFHKLNRILITKKEMRAGAMIWVWGCIILFVVAVVLCSQDS